jgi:hypothetical protein
MDDHHLGNIKKFLLKKLLLYLDLGENLHLQVHWANQVFPSATCPFP